MPERSHGSRVRSSALQAGAARRARCVPLLQPSPAWQAAERALGLLRTPPLPLSLATRVFGNFSAARQWALPCASIIDEVYIARSGRQAGRRALSCARARAGWARAGGYDDALSLAARLRLLPVGPHRPGTQALSPRAPHSPHRRTRRLTHSGCVFAGRLLSDADRGVPSARAPREPRCCTDSACILLTPGVREAGCCCSLQLFTATGRGRREVRG